MKTKVICVLDGFGLLPSSQNNAVALAVTPNLNRIFTTYPYTTLDADGESVGQEHGLVGNSEVGHMNIGGLQLVKQLSYQITKSAEQSFERTIEANEQLHVPREILHTQTLYTPSFLEKIIDSITQHTFKVEPIHLIGLFSKGTIHSDLRHWVGAIESAGKAGCTEIVLHLISDGRDSDRKSFVDTWKTFTTTHEKRLEPYIHLIKLGSVIGRFYAMDRDNNLDRTQKALDSMFGEQVCDITYEGILPKLEEITQKSYEKAVYDETILPQLVGRGIDKDDIVWFVNFRSDRMKQLAKLMIETNNSKHLDLLILANNSYSIGYEYTENDVLKHIETIRNHLLYVPLFMRKELSETLADYIEEQGKTQLHIAETEKYAHVTYFMNGGKDTKHVGEEWIIIDSNKVESHAQKPEMKCKEITDYILEQGLGKYDYIMVNYANPDMIGHTGELHAAITSMEALDAELGRLITAIEEGGHSMVLTADHGNIEVVGEYNRNKDEYLDTEHNPNPVPCVIVGEGFDVAKINAKFNELKFEIDIPKALDANDMFNIGEKKATLDSDGNWLVKESIPLPQYPLWYAGLVLVALTNKENSSESI
jgi:2,3-bisphosphoglycerate-independent phosphoglycerate mutase